MHGARILATLEHRRSPASRQQLAAHLTLHVHVHPASSPDSPGPSFSTYFSGRCAVRRVALAAAGRRFCWRSAAAVTSVPKRRVRSASIRLHVCLRDCPSRQCWIVVPCPSNSFPYCSSSPFLFAEFAATFQYHYLYFDSLHSYSYLMPEPC